MIVELVPFLFFALLGVVVACVVGVARLSRRRRRR